MAIEKPLPPSIRNTSQHAFIVGPGPRSKRKPGETPKAIVIHPADAESSNGVDPSVVRLTEADAARLKDDFVLRAVANAHIGLEVG